MWEPQDEQERDASRRRSQRRTTPLLARHTPLLRDERMIDAAGAGVWLAPTTEWSGPLPVPVAHRQTLGIIGQRLDSIEAVPYELLGWADRLFLLHWARKGYPVYAYRAPTGHWNLWFDHWRIELPLPDHLRLTPSW